CKSWAIRDRSSGPRSPCGIGEVCMAFPSWPGPKAARLNRTIEDKKEPWSSLVPKAGLAADDGNERAVAVDINRPNLARLPEGVKPVVLGAGGPSDFGDLRRLANGSSWLE